MPDPARTYVYFVAYSVRYPSGTDRAAWYIHTTTAPITTNDDLTTLENALIASHNPYGAVLHTISCLTLLAVLEPS